MVTNLLHNAIVYNVADHGTVTIRTASRPGSIQLTVENSGEVITTDVVATLTEPFQRGTARVRGDYPGVGLGLAIVKSIAQAHHGVLTLTPRDIGGLRVTVQLPADVTTFADSTCVLTTRAGQIVPVADSWQAQ
jgi:two-component system sensor histidine kinase VanS